MASKRSTQLATKYQRALDKATKKGVRIANQLSLGLYKDLIKKYKAADYVFGPTIDSYSMVFSVQVEIGAIMAHLLGMVMYSRAADSQPAPSILLTEEEDALRQYLVNSGFSTARHGSANEDDIFDFAIQPNAETIADLADEIDLSVSERQRIASRYQMTARTAGREFSTRLNSRLTDAIQDITINELTETQGIKRIKEAFELAGTSARHDYWYTTIYRTETQIAMSGGRWQSATDPILGTILWGFEYVTMGDQHVRPLHAKADGTILSKNDPWWNINFPPCGYNCRCQAIEIFSKEKIKRSEITNVNDSENFETNWKTAPVVEGI